MDDYHCAAEIMRQKAFALYFKFVIFAAFFQSLRKDTQLQRVDASMSTARMIVKTFFIKIVPIILVCIYKT